MPTPPVITIDQATLGAGSAGESRSDGVPNQVVTVTASPTSAYAPNNDADRYALRILSVEPVSDSAPAITQASNRTWTFTPPANSYGRSYRIELTVDGGTEFEAVVIRTFSVRTQRQAWRLPAPGEYASPNTTIPNSGADQVALSETNEGASPWGWHPALTEALRDLDNDVGQHPVNLPVVSASLVVLGAIRLDAGDYASFDAYASKDATLATLTIELYDPVGAAVLATITHNAASTARAALTSAAGFTVPDASAGYLEIRASVSTGAAAIFNVGRTRS